MNKIQSTLISIVTPVLNEEANLPLLYNRIKAVFEKNTYDFELILVESGSTDRSVTVAKELIRNDSRVKLISMSRIFSHQIALTAGLDHANGAAVILMDSDLQHPPEIIPQFIEKWKQGYENIYTLRTNAPETSWVRKSLSSLFYSIFKKLTRLDLPANSADFRLLDRKVVLHLRQFHERNRFLRGLICWVGFKSIGIPYQEAARISGRTKYNPWRLLVLSIDAITSFTSTPLYIGVIVGFIIAMAGFLYLIFVFYTFLFTTIRLPGWTSIISLLSILGGFMLLVMGLIGIYIGKIFEEVKQRPLYVIDFKEGFNDQ